MFCIDQLSTLSAKTLLFLNWCLKIAKVTSVKSFWFCMLNILSSISPVSQYHLPNWIFKPKHQPILLKFIQLKNICLVNCHRINYHEFVTKSHKILNYKYKPLLNSSNSDKINKILVEKSGGSDINNVGLRENQAIIDAIKNKNINLVKLLIKHGMDINNEQLYKPNSLPIQIAIKINHSNIIILLLKARAQLKNCIPNKCVLQYLNSIGKNTFGDEDSENEEEL